MMIADALQTLGAANLALAAGVGAAAALRRPVRAAFGARAAYGLWALPIAAAAAIAAPHSGLHAGIAPFVATAGAAAGRMIPRAVAHASALPALLAGGWAAGALAAAGLLAARQQAFLRSLGRLTPAGGRLVRAEACGVGPALVGALRPVIVAPADFETRFTPDEQALVLAHEAAHLAAGDAAVNALACAVQCLCWFNPAAHLGARLMRADQELACDAAVIGKAPGARRLYGELLLKTQLSTQPLPLGCHWPARSPHPLKERIAMLKSPLPARARRAAGAGLVAGLALAAGGLAWAAKAPSVILQPDWLVRPTAEDMAKFYPPEAVKAHVEGFATLGCEVAADGRLAHCKVLKETPPGAGFGQAAMAMSSLFQMKPMSKDGHPTSGGVVRIPIRFALPSPPAPPTA
jgi:TonB family protein